MTHRMPTPKNLRCRLFGHHWQDCLHTALTGTRTGQKCSRCDVWLWSMPTSEPTVRTPS